MLSNDITTRPLPPPGYVMQSEDTEYWAEELQFEHWRGLDPLDKAELFASLCRAAFEMHLIGLRELHPHASVRELLLRSAALRLGRRRVLDITGFDAGED